MSAVRLLEKRGGGQSPGSPMRLVELLPFPLITPSIYSNDNNTNKVGLLLVLLLPELPVNVRVSFCLVKGFALVLCVIVVRQCTISGQLSVGRVGRDLACSTDVVVRGGYVFIFPAGGCAVGGGRVVRGRGVGRVCFVCRGVVVSWGGVLLWVFVTLFLCRREAGGEPLDPGCPPAT